MMRKKIARTSAAALCAVMVLQMFPANTSAAIFQATDQKLTIEEKKQALKDTEKTEYEEGEVIVMYDASSFQESERSLSAVGLPSDITVTDSVTFSDMEVTDGLSAAGVSSTSTADRADLTVSLLSSSIRSTKELISLLKDVDGILYAEPNYIVHTSDAVSLRDNKDLLWALDNTGQNGGIADGSADYNTDINADALASLKNSPSETVVAIIDTGIDVTNPDLAEHLWDNPFPSQLLGEHGYNFCYDNYYYSSYELLDDNGHGSHCTGIMNSVANPDGSDNVSFMGLKVFDMDGDANDFDFILAYHYLIRAIKLGVNVVAVNNSWGGEFYSAILDSLVNEAGQLGCISVYAAGNEGYDNDAITYSSNLNSEYAITVAAATESGTLASFSNYGKSQVDFAAPGTDILSTVNYNCFNPTIYNESQIAELCDDYVDFNMIDYSTYTEAAKSSAAPFDVLSQTVYPLLPFKDAADETISFTISSNDYITNRTNTDSHGSLAINIAAKKGKTYRIAIPYYANASNCTSTINTMLKFDVPDYAGDELSVLYYYDLDSADCMDGETLSKIDLDSKAVLSGGTFVSESIEYWAHLNLTGASAGTDGMHLFVLEFECDTTGDHTFYLDDFAVSAANKNLELTAEYGKLEYLSGTSMAAPYVAGAIGLLSTKEDYAACSTQDKCNLLRSCTTKNPYLDQMTFDGMLDLSLLTNDGHTKTPIINNVTTDGKNVVLKGSSLNDCTILVNGNPVNTNASDDGSTLTFDGTGYINHYITVSASKNDRTSSYSTYLENGKPKPEQLCVSDLTADHINAVASDGLQLYALYDGSLYTYNPYPEMEMPYTGEDGNDPSDVEDMPVITDQALADFTFLDAPSFDVFEGSQIDDLFDYSVTFADNQLAYLNRHLYMIAELSQLNSSYLPFLTECYILDYDIDQEYWEALKIPSSVSSSSPLHMACTEQTLAAYNGKLYVIGGYSTLTKTMTDEVAVYNPETEKWTAGTPLPEKRAGGQALQVGDTLVYTLGLAEQENKTGGSYPTITLPATLTYSDSSWHTGTATLHAYNYETVNYGGRVFYRVHAGLGLCKNSILFTGITSEGYGDVFYYSLTKDAYSDSGYNGAGDLHGNTLLGSVIDDTMYAISYEAGTNTSAIYSLPVKRGTVHITYGNAKISVFAESGDLIRNHTYMPGERLRLYAKGENGYYIRSLNLKDKNGQTIKLDNDFKRMTVTSDLSLGNYKLGKYVTKIKLNKTNMTYQYKENAANKIQLKATVSPVKSKYYVNRSLTWKTSNQNLATVTKNGKVTVKKAAIGKTVKIKVTAKDGSKAKKTCTIKVTN